MLPGSTGMRCQALCFSEDICKSQTSEKRCMNMLQPEAAPVLSTPDIHIFENPESLVDSSSLPRLDDEQLKITYEIQRTVGEIRNGRWKRIALQFPDSMLVDAPRVFQALSRGLQQARKSNPPTQNHNHSAGEDPSETTRNLRSIQISEDQNEPEEKLYILADTSYGACCVDEVAAEHAEADVVVHYGRSCLSPTARLPVIYVFTRPPLALEPMLEAFKNTYPNQSDKIILMADIPFASYVKDFADNLEQAGYSNIFVTSILHDTASPLPNRTVPSDVTGDVTCLQNYQLFHISDPPPSLLLTLSSRVGAIHIYPTSNIDVRAAPKPLLANSSAALRRRYALLTRVSTVPIIGILINTLSVKSYLDVLTRLKKLIASAGKKSYTFVVGKVNAAKVANFSEVGGWVVIGCWESSLFDSSEFWKPVITPWELELALKGDERRIWTGAWRSDFGSVLEEPEQNAMSNGDEPQTKRENAAEMSNGGSREGSDSEEESEPPEFDLRTGQYVSHSRPMAVRPKAAVNQSNKSESLIKRPKGDLATVGGEISPAADFFRNKRSWQGLGSDFEIEYDEDGAMKSEAAATVEPGRRGIARGYVVGDDATEGSKR